MQLLTALRSFWNALHLKYLFDIIDSGIYVMGGSANIRNLDRLIQQETDLDVNICKDASNAVALGLGRIMEEPELITLLQRIC